MANAETIVKSPTENLALDKAQEDFITQWGVLGSAWGVNRTMAQIHALLLISQEPLSTDDVMERLGISRGNANTNLRDLVGWSLIHSVLIRGERKEFFVAEKDVWKIFCTVVRERKRREVNPALNVLRDCEAQTENLDSPEAEAFHKQILALREFVEMADSAMDKIASSEQSKVLPAMLKIIK